eukprot:m.21922 g.21922  ORF g.21922 m.21922 type:complete len:186 (+) comp10802_c0_seq1:1382-1939(+)
MANHGKAYGMSEEVKRKQEAKYDPELEGQARMWLEALTGMAIGEDFHEGLKDGVILCKALNVLAPGAIKKINESKMPFKMMENIGKYLEAAEAYGVQRLDNFQTVDLYEAKNMTQVVDGIHALGRAAQAHGFNGPVIGAHPSEAAPRHFDQSTLEAGKAVLPAQSGYTGGANQKGMNFGLGRQIK